MTSTGTVADVNAALARVDYLGNAIFRGSDSFNIGVDDQGNTGSGATIATRRSLRAIKPATGP
jgi:hypothetical protein